MGPIYKYGLENNKQSKKPLSFAFKMGDEISSSEEEPKLSNAEKLAAEYGRNVGDTAIEQSNMGENIIDEAASEAKAVKSVREGKLERKENFKEAKKEVKSKRDDNLSKLDKKKKSYLETSGNTEGTGYNDISNRKQIRSEKRREMQDVRDKERGARNADRRNRGIERMANRNNMSTEDAAKAYDTRMSTYQAYNVNSNNEKAVKALESTEKNSSFAENLVKDATAGISGGKKMKTNTAKD